jgi:hypothetical protein
MINRENETSVFFERVEKYRREYFLLIVSVPLMMLVCRIMENFIPLLQVIIMFSMFSVFGLFAYSHFSSAKKFICPNCKNYFFIKKQIFARARPWPRKCVNCGFESMK